LAQSSEEFVKLWLGKPEEQAEFSILALIQGDVNDARGWQVLRGLIDHQHQDAATFSVNANKEFERM